MDRFGARLLLTSGALVCCCACLLLSHIHDFNLALVSRVLMGFGCAFAFVGAVHLLREWFPSEYFSVLLGFMESSAMILCLFGSVAVAKLVHMASWTQSMAVFAYAALIIGIACFTIIREPQKNHTTPFSFKHSLIAIIRQPILWLNGIYSGILFLTVTLFAGLWAVPFLQSELHCSLELATMISSLIYIGVAFGCPAIAWYANRQQYVRGIFISSSLITASILVIILFYPITSIGLMSSLFFCAGLSCSPYILNFALANMLAPDYAKSTSIGFTNTLCVATAPIFQAIAGMGITFHHHLGFRLDNDYNFSDFQFGLSIIPIMLLFSALLALKLPHKLRIYRD